ncbi:class I SAM-dependent DNA methyltransferase [Mesorhizobium atlanticum]|uniref:Class I SAM-dependent methyltransferase n=1 Tax=Mesorhizobium atlanticum TaxID=2233532 RepID=A0A330GMA1_9HYPH|nr:class I SAM-dependent methyltransferase [Mesorhizobium atlanticum]RAZ73000.1 class I SAM-dependent methyltransferase [Mesorhizobium atlanticum]
MSSADPKTAAEQAARERIKTSHALNGDTVRLAQLYRGWADTFDQDQIRVGYCGPVIVAELAGAVQKAYLDGPRNAVRVLDAGCGTGLVGMELQRLGFGLIDGFDLSEDMAEKARQTGVYRHVRGDIDLNGLISDYSSATYDLTVCCGVFTLGHVRPDGLRELARITRPNGFIIASTRKSYADVTSFESEVRRLQGEGVVKLVQCLRNGRYLEEEDGHYWILQMPASHSGAERA